MAEAVESEPRDPNAMALATVGTDGLPDVRMVLMKGFDAQGFVFYTNLGSQKGRELAGRAEGRAPVLLEERSTARSACAGRSRRVTDAEADAYFATRNRDGADRRLGLQAIRAARKPARIRESGRALHREIRRRRGAAPAALVRLSHRADGDRILARPAVPPARPRSNSGASASGRVEQDADVSVAHDPEKWEPVFG